MGSNEYAVLLLIATALVIIAATARVFFITRDTFHPMVVLGPMLLYVFVFRPSVLLSRDLLFQYFSGSQLIFVLSFKLCAVASLCAGCMRGISKAPRTSGPLLDEYLSPQGRKTALVVACFMAFIGLICYAAVIKQNGGLLAAYSYAYGGAYSSIGYLVDAPLWSCPAVLLLAISRQGRACRLQDVGLALLFLSPMLLQGFLGARRGFAFFSLMTLWCAWYVYRMRRPSLPKSLFVLVSMGMVALALLVYRSNIYIGSKFNIDSRDFVREVFAPERLLPGDDFLDSSGLLLTIHKYGRHNWGTRLLVTYLVRPIPRLLWPSKYDDCGFAWFESKTERWGYTDVEWQNAAGFTPIMGMSTGFDGSFYLDFSWGAFIGCYFAGRLFSFIWLKERQNKGAWQILLGACLTLSIFFPAQDFSAFFYRWLFIALPAAFFWHYLIARSGMELVRTRASAW